MKLRSHGHSDIGCVRSENEDSFLCNDTLHLYAVADGIGGLPAGAQASQQTVFTLEKLFREQPPGQRIDYAHVLSEVNRTVFELGHRISPRFGIGSTLTFAHLVMGRLHIGHVGDSTGLRLRNGSLEQLTTDHTIENEIKERTARGESLAVLLENRAALTRCIGQPPPLTGQCVSYPLQPFDRILLASDGVSRFLSPTEIKQTIAETNNPTDASKKLINMANERGGLDNATAVLIYVD
ncbi:PP2C family protein-serine/threonine phosphatase [Oleiharenicola lentus]|uniref:PP2C family protein-serine/threonine phosphatase n=1 Tax=Oleiharenicola lentus TaxID=2508720 RepID=UPI003F66FBFA